MLPARRAASPRRRTPTRTGEEGTDLRLDARRARRRARAGRGEPSIARYGVTRGRTSRASNILSVRRPRRGRALAEARRRLLEARLRRPQPARDDKALAAWNGLTLAALAEAGLRLDRPDYLDAARGARRVPARADDRRARAPLPHLPRRRRRRSTGTSRTTRTSRTGCSSSTRRPASCAISTRRTGSLGSRSSSSPTTQRGGFFFTPADGEQLVARKKELDDNPTPSGQLDARLRAAPSGADLRRRELERLAVEVFRLAYRYLDRLPSAVGRMMCALDLHFAPPREVAIVGPADDRRRGSARRCVRSFRPKPSTLRRRRRRSSRLGAYRSCGQGARRRPAGRVRLPAFACRAPVTDPARWQRSSPPSRSLGLSGDGQANAQRLLGQWGVRERPEGAGEGRALQAELEGSAPQDARCSCAAGISARRRFLRRLARRAASVHAAPARDRAADGRQPRSWSARWQELAVDCAGDPARVRGRWRAEVGGTTSTR